MIIYIEQRGKKLDFKKVFSWLLVVGWKKGDEKRKMRNGKREKRNERQEFVAIIITCGL